MNEVTGKHEESISGLCADDPVAGKLYFRFEEDFIEGGHRCIPMIVRFKLDACGIKLQLAQWTRMTCAERKWLAIAPCTTQDEIAHYKKWLCALVLERTGNHATEIVIPENPAWSYTNDLPAELRKKLNETEMTIGAQQWKALTDLQRFALVKLSRPGHENKNFPRAMLEFLNLPEKNHGDT